MLARLAELPLLVVLLGITGVVTLLPAVHAFAMDDNALARSFFYAAMVIMMFATMLGIATAGYVPRDPARGQLSALVLAYVLLPAAATFAMVEAVPDTSPMNAWFEMISCFTTTGATAYAPDRLADSVHLWRATVGWFGGFLTLLAAYAILAPLNLGGFEVSTGRVPGRGAKGTAQILHTADPTVRLSRFALQLFPLYTAMTLLLWFGLLFLSDDGLAALIHAMGTFSTSGITGQTAFSASAAGVPGEILIFFCFVFALTRRALPGVAKAEDRHPLYRDPELRLAALLVGLVTLLLFLRHWVAVVPQTPDSAVQALSATWGIIFTATSFLTTTGYISGSWETASDWSGIGISGLVLVGLAMIGGGTATAAGGVKLLRVYALMRHGERELDRIIFPSSVGRGGASVRRLQGEGAQLAWVFFMLFATSLAAVVALLLLVGTDFEAALILAVAALSTTGQLADIAAAEPILYSAQSDAVKLVLGIAMVVGRLETLALLALILPGRNRR